MGEKFGLRFSNKTNGFSDVSQESRNIIDGDIESLLNEAYNHAKGLIKGKRTVLDALAKRLIEVETLDSEEVQGIIGVK
jgi:cell division protease FtsH